MILSVSWYNYNNNYIHTKKKNGIKYKLGKKQNVASIIYLIYKVFEHVMAIWYSMTTIIIVSRSNVMMCWSG